MGSSSRPQTVNQVTQYPEWFQAPMQDLIARTGTLADQREAAGYQGYDPAQRIAGMNPLQMQALQQAQQSAGSWSPFLQQAAGGMAAGTDLALQAATRPANSYSMNAAFGGPSAMVQAGNLSQANLGGYMNPYTDMVTNNALGKLEESRQLQQQTNAEAANRARAFGGSRHGLVEAQTNAAFGKQAADTALNAAQANFANAQGMATNDINRNLQAQGMNQGAYNQMNQFNAGLAQQANQFNAGQGQQMDLAMRNFGLDAANTLGNNASQWGNLASLYQNFGANDMNNLFRAGGMLQDQDQAMRDAQYQEWQNAQNFPLENLALRQSALTNSPFQPGQSTTSPLYRNRTAGFLGGAQQGYGNTDSIWGALIGGLMGAYG